MIVNINTREILEQVEETAKELKTSVPVRRLTSLTPLIHASVEELNIRKAMSAIVGRTLNRHDADALTDLALLRRRQLQIAELLKQRMSL